MVDIRFITCSLAVLCLAFASVASEKQIKLEDIEKDTLKAAHQAKIEKQLQEQQQQQQQQQQQHQQFQYQYQQPAYQYGAQHSVSYQTPNSYFQYIVPQQYLPQTHSQYIPLSADYASLTGKSLGVAFASPSNHAYQTYLSPQIASVPALSGYHHAGQSLEALAQSQPIVMAFPSPLTGLQQNHHQQYYQSALQYYPSTQSQQATAQYYYAPTHVSDQTSSLQYASGGSSGSEASASVYPTAQQYIAYQPLTTGKGSTSYSQFVSSSPHSYPGHAFTTQHGYSSLYAPQAALTTSNAYSNTETPIFVTVKAPKHLVASSGQKQQFSQLHTTTLSPLQTKYLNSPQYLAQNYNTIQSSHFPSKGSLSSGVKSTVAPPLKSSLVAAGSSISSSSSSYLNSGHSISFPTPPFKGLPRSHSV